MKRLFNRCVAASVQEIRHRVRPGVEFERGGIPVEGV